MLLSKNSIINVLGYEIEVGSTVATAKVGGEYKDCVIYGIEIFDESRPWILLRVDPDDGWYVGREHIKEYRVKERIKVSEELEDFLNNRNIRFWWYPLRDIKIATSFWRAD